MSCKYENFFSMKTDNLIINWVTLSLANILFLKGYSQFNKIWNQGDFENPDFPTLVNCEKFISKTFAYIHKTQFSIFFMNQDKMRGSARATFKNYKISLWIGKKTWKVSQRPTLKNLNFESMDEKEKVLS